MKQKTIAILLTIALLAGCNTPAPAAPSAAEPDMEAIIQQSVDEAVKEKLEQIEEEQRKKDEEIAKLKEQLEELTSQQEAPPEESSSAPAENASSQVPVSSQPAAPASSSQAGVPPQPEPEPPPQSAPAPKKTTPSSSGGGFDLKNLYPDYVWEGSVEESEEDPEDEPYENDSDSAPSGGCHRLEDALEVIRLTNEEREKNDLPALEVDEDLMELARIRAEETRELYSHTRPDGTTVVDLRCGENIGQRSSAEKQVIAWMNSDGHRTNILLDRYHHIGVGCYQAENGNLYWVQVFSLD